MRQRSFTHLFFLYYFSVFWNYLTTLVSQYALVGEFTFQVFSPRLSRRRNSIFETHKSLFKSKEKHRLSHVSFIMLYITGYIITVWGKDYSALTGNPFRSLLYQLRTVHGCTNFSHFSSNIHFREENNRVRLMYDFNKQTGFFSSYIESPEVKGREPKSPSSFRSTWQLGAPSISSVSSNSAESRSLHISPQQISSVRLKLSINENTRMSYIEVCSAT